MKTSYVAVIAIIASFIISVPVLADDANAFNSKTPGVIMKFCQNPAMTLQDCDEQYDGYTWTDRINVLIYAPAWNQDSDKVDHIGKAHNGGNIEVSTRNSSSNEVVFSETGIDTGIFMGVVKLTGQSSKEVHNENGSVVTPMGMNMDNYHTTCTMMQKNMGMCSKVGLEQSPHDWAVKLKTDHQNGAVTVAWEANEDMTVVKTATWEWRLGEIEFTKEKFGIDESITFKLHDADLWNHHATFHTYYMHTWSDTDTAGIYVPVQFTPNHANHGDASSGHGGHGDHQAPAEASLTKYTPNGEYKMYLWWQPGGVMGVDRDYSINFMVHDGVKDIHQPNLSYGMEIWLNGELLETRSERFADDGQAIEPIRFDERGTAKIVIFDIMGEDLEIDFSFQIAPEAILKHVGNSSSYNEVKLPKEWEGRVHGHYVDLLEGEFTVTYDDSSKETNSLRVSNGDSIYVEYVDKTLPKDNDGLIGGPHSINDEEEIKARASVFDHRVGMIIP